jgi:hypothetical protein
MNEESDKPNPDHWRGFIMLPEDVKELTKQDVHPEVFSMEPTGNLIHVVLEVEPDEYGHLVIPKSITDGTRMGCGYIIAVGPVAGSPQYATSAGAVGVLAQNPAQLLGYHVLFAAHIGVPIRVSMLDTEYKGAVLVMSSKDIRGVDCDAEPLTDRAMRRSKE